MLRCMRLREATADDAQLLTDLLVDAVNWTGEQRVTRADALAVPVLAHYVTGWPRPGDFGMVAVSDDGAALGAVWARLFTDEDPGFGFVATDVPELTLGVLEHARGRQVGSTLMTAIIEQARALGHGALSLSVEDGNDLARGLYERRGFTVVGRVGDSDTLLRHLAPSPVTGGDEVAETRSSPGWRTRG